MSSDPRGHCQRARPGSDLARHRRGGDRPARAARGRRARPCEAPAHRFTVRHEEVALERLLDHGTVCSPRMHGVGRSTSRSRARKRRPSSCPTESVLQVITNLLRTHFDGRRTVGRSNCVSPPWRAVSVDSSIPGRVCQRRSARGSSRRSSPRMPRALASAFRSPASSRWHSAVGSSSARMPMRGAGSGSCCRSHRRSCQASASSGCRRRRRAPKLARSRHVRRVP